MPEAVVQRFVDAANARNPNAMAVLVAPDAVFARFPGGQVIAQNRDGIREHYSRQLQSLPPDFRITVQPRIVEGQIVIDHEHFTGMPAERNQATWMYLVRDGLIRRAWVLDGKPTPAPMPMLLDTPCMGRSSLRLGGPIENHVELMWHRAWTALDQQTLDTASVLAGARRE